MIARPAVVLVLLLLGIGSSSSSQGPQTSAEARTCRASPADLIGRWKETRHGFISEIKQQGDGYVLINIADAEGILPRPEVTGEFRAVSERPCTFRGRHVWGGQRYATKSWGEEGGLVVEQLSPDSIFIRFLDSRYTGGWTYLRVRTPSTEARH